MKICFHSFEHPRYSGFVDTKLVIDNEQVDTSWCEARGFAVSHENVSIGGDLYVDIPANMLRRCKSVHWTRNAYPGGRREWRGSGARSIKKLAGVRDATLPSAWTRLPSAGDALACRNFYDRLMAFKGPKLNLMIDKYRSILRRESAARDALTAARCRLRPYYTNAQLCAMSHDETLRIDAALEKLAQRRFARHNVIL